MPSGTIILEPEHGVYFEDDNSEPRFQRAKEISMAPTQHLINLLTIIPNDKDQILPFMFNKIIRQELDKRFKRGEEFIDIPPPYSRIIVIFLSVQILHVIVSLLL